MVNIPLQCEQVWLEISNYLDGEIDPGLRAAMETHIRTCQRCTTVLEGTRNAIRLYSDERMREVPAGFGRRLEKRLEKRLAENARVSGTRWSTWSAWLVPVAALALVAGGFQLANSLTVTHPVQSPMAQFAHDIPPDMVVVVSADAKLFHAPGCGAIHNKQSERTMTAKEAMAKGYAPCLRCLRKYLDTASVGNARLGSEAQAIVDADADADAEVHAAKHQGGQ